MATTATVGDTITVQTFAVDETQLRLLIGAGFAFLIVGAGLLAIRRWASSR